MAPTKPLPPIAPPSTAVKTARTADGTYNDLDDPRMGMTCARFGRNIPFADAWPETGDRLMTPDPRVVSRRLMTRDEFKPVPERNVLIATWIQFMIRDWFSHGHGNPDKPFRLPVRDGDTWPEPDIVIPSTISDPTRPDDGREYPPTYLNEHTAWWDGSSIYGVNHAEQDFLRSHAGGKLNLTPDGVPVLPTGDADPSKIPGFWTGVAMMGMLFAQEHNSVCDALLADNPHWDPKEHDEEIFQRARLVVSALLAKIHTVEWTPAILWHETTVAALRANWYGLAGQKIRDTFGRIGGRSELSEVISGIPGGEPHHWGTKYSLTEEFTIVYRMHPLIPDDYRIRNWQNDEMRRSYTLRELSGPAGREILEDSDAADLLYSFGTEMPGQLVLNNFPKHLQEFERPDGRYTDLAATDILRTRELGVPRYNDFREALHLKRVGSFEELTDDPATVATLRELYDTIDDVDTIIGMFAEKFPRDFGFSDTAFRIFVLMATRRLNSDRFLTEDFTPEVYTRAGYRWVVDNDMTSVLLRHYPQLRAALRGVENPFHLWNTAG